MKTAIIYNEVFEQISYYVASGDYRHLHGVYANLTGTDRDREDQLVNLIEGDDCLQSVTIEEFQQAIKDGAVLIETGWVS